MKIIYSFTLGFWYWENEYARTCSARKFENFETARTDALEYGVSMHASR